MDFLTIISCLGSCTLMWLAYIFVTPFTNDLFEPHMEDHVNDNKDLLEEYKELYELDCVELDNLYQRCHSMTKSEFKSYLNEHVRSREITITDSTPPELPHSTGKPQRPLSQRFSDGERAGTKLLLPGNTGT